MLDERMDNMRPWRGREPKRPMDAEEENISYPRPNRLLVFGGTFDPVHNGHLRLARQILTKEWADEVLFVPALRSPLKLNAQVSSGLHRLEMLKLALDNQDGFSYSDLELQRRSAVSYTIDTMNTLSRIYPDHEVGLLIGMDSLCTLSKWHRAQELVQRFQILVYPRPGVTPPAYVHLSKHFGYRNAKRLMDSILPEAEIETFTESGTAIRAGVRAGEDMSGMVPALVWQYIREHKLYQD
ncbi:MAG: nicotinate (nicotinamide) nucleotide adenylyltransferase [Lentisphaeria bacterium]|jgi:nicotinate-nucleotide adenylyltransferase